MKKLFFFLLLLAGGITGGIYWYGIHNNGPNGHEKYTLAPAEFGTLTETVSATGTLQPTEITLVCSEIGGKVAEISANAEINQIVEEGEPLLRLDDRKARLEVTRAATLVEAANAQVTTAEAVRYAADVKVTKLKALDPMVRQGKDLDEAEAQLKAAEAAVKAAGVRVKEADDVLKLAQLGLDLTVVRVPGPVLSQGASQSPKKKYTIIDRKVVTGQLVGPQSPTPLFTLSSDIGKLHLHAQVSENDLGKVRVSKEFPQQATFSVYAYSNDDLRFTGRVTEVRPLPSNQLGAVFYSTLIDVTNVRDPKTREWLLRPGMTATVDLVLRQHEKVWKVPTAALNFQLDPHYQTETARARLAEFQQRKDAQDWKPLWIVDAQQKPWPVFVRVSSKDAKKETGIVDAQFTEVFEWDPEFRPKPDAGSKDSLPKFIIGAPPVNKGSLFDRATVRVF